MSVDKFIPKQGEVVIDNWNNEVEFLVMTSKGCYLCWNEDKTETFSCNKVSKKPEETVCYYRWESLRSGIIHTSLYITDEYALKHNYTKELGWHRLEHTKRTWEH